MRSLHSLRRSAIVLLSCVAGALLIPTMVAAEETTTTTPVEPQPVDTVPIDGMQIDPVTGLPAAMGPLIIVPAGCSQPTPALAVFRGVVTAFDDADRPSAARLQMTNLLAGELPPSVNSAQIDVSLGTEARFLTVGTEYLIGVKVDAATGLLASSVGEPAPLFGGDAVIGLDDVATACPTVPDPIRVLHTDGTPVDTSVLAPLHGEGSSLLRALLVPLAIAFGALVAIVLLKQLFAGAVRAASER